MLWLSSLKKQWIWFSACFHSTLNKQWKVFHMLSLLCTKQCMGFSTCCHCSLSSISGCSFSCTFKAHLLSMDGFPYVVTAASLSSGYGFPHVVTALSKSSGWFFILSLKWTKQCMGFSTCCHCSLSNISGYSFSCPVKAHLVSTGWISICCHCCFTKQWIWFSTMPSLKKQWMVFHLVTVAN